MTNLKPALRMTTYKKGEGFFPSPLLYVSSGCSFCRIFFTRIVCRKPVTSVMWRNAHALDFNNEHTTLLNITVNCYT